MSSAREVLLGRIAVKRGLIAPQELTLVLEEQARRGSPPLGGLLVELGLLSQIQLDELLAEQKRALSAPSEKAPAAPDRPAITKGENLLGRRAVAMGLLTQEQLNDCIRLQGVREGQGRLQRIGEILVEKGHLTASQVAALLGDQGVRLFRCPKCRAQYNVAGVGPAPACPRCKVTIVPAGSPAPRAPRGPAKAPPSPSAPVGASDQTTVLPVVEAPVQEEPSAPAPASPPASAADLVLPDISADGTFYYSKETVELPAVEPPAPRPPAAAPAKTPLPSQRPPAKHPTPPPRPAPPPPARRPAGGTTKRRKKAAKPRFVDYRRRRLGAPSSMQWIGLAAIGGAALLVFLLVGGSSSKSPSGSSRTEDAAAFPSSTGGGTQIASEEQWRAYVTSLPADPADRLRALGKMDLSGPMGPRARKEISQLEADLRAKLEEEFKRRRKEASDHAAKNEWPEALAAWDGFPHRLDVKGEYKGRVAGEVAALQKRAEEHELAVRPPRPPTGQTPAPVAPQAGPGQKRVEEARAAIAKRRKEVADLKAAEFARLKDGSVAHPIELDVNGQLLKGCVFTEVNEDGGLIQVKDPPVMTSLFFAYLKPPTLYRIRKAMTNQDDVASRFALGRYAALLGLYKEAEAEFRWVVSKDASYESRIPDLGKLKQRGIVFHGAVQSGFDRYKVTYDFTSPDEALDFQTDQGNVSVEKGQLVLAGASYVGASLKEVAFAGEATLSVAMGAVPEKTLAGWGLDLSCADGKSVSVLVLSSPGQLWVMAKTPGAEKLDEKATLEAHGGEELVFRLEKGTQIALLSGKTVLWSDSVPAVTSCGISLIAVHREKQPVRVGFDRIVMDGKIRPEWMRKMRAESEVRALRTLEEDLRLTSDEASEPPVEPLSVEARAGLSSSDLDVLHAARQVLVKRGVTWEEYGKALTDLGHLIERNPRFAGALFVMAQLLSMIGVDDGADAFLDAAIEVEPRFYEALCERARLAVHTRDLAAARRDIAAALAARADCGEAYAARGYVLISERKFAEAMDELELAIELSPSDRNALHLLKDARHLLKGPWPKESGKTEYVSDTEHFRIRTDTGAKKAKEYAERLERARKVYASEIPPPSASERAEVVIFDTEEAYHTYAELTGDDRVESTLGYFHPLYNQLFLFEGATDVSGQETLHVLFHEGFHQYLDGIIPFAPTWCNEGLAEYYGGKAFVTETGMKRDPFLAIRLSNLQSAMSSGFKVDFERIMDMSQAEFYQSWAPVLYAQGWAMCHWFLEVAPKAERDGFLAYLEEIRKGAKREDARTRAFAGRDVRDMERRWSEWVRAWRQ